MVIGVDRRCVSCGVPVRSCVLPAYCFQCDPDIGPAEVSLDQLWEYNG